MTRKQALAAIRAAGVDGNQALFIRTYVENRISYAVAIAEYREGVAWRKRFEARQAVPA